MGLKLAIVTAGAVGAYFGGRLVQVGTEVRFLARGEHLQALQTSGLKVTSTAGDFGLAPNRYFVSADAAEVVRGADLVFFAVKSFDAATTARSLLPGLGEKAVVISLLNGIEHMPLLCDILGPERVVAGAAYIGVTLDGPGAIRQTHMGRVSVAANTEAGQPVPLLDELKSLSDKAGFGFEIASDSLTLLWSKLVFISALSGWTTATRRKIDGLLASPELREAFKATLLETATIAKAAGAKLEPETLINNTMGFAEKLGAMGSSMLYDFEHGKRIEVDALNGAVVRKGRELGLSTPYNQALLALLSSYEL